MPIVPINHLFMTAENKREKKEQNKRPNEAVPFHHVENDEHPAMVASSLCVPHSKANGQFYSLTASGKNAFATKNTHRRHFNSINKCIHAYLKCTVRPRHSAAHTLFLISVHGAMRSGTYVDGAHDRPVVFSPFIFS